MRRHLFQKGINDNQQQYHTEIKLVHISYSVYVYSMPLTLISRYIRVPWIAVQGSRLDGLIHGMHATLGLICLTYEELS
jgi:hypothetical protein